MYTKPGLVSFLNTGANQQVSQPRRKMPAAKEKLVMGQLSRQNKQTNMCPTTQFFPGKCFISYIYFKQIKVQRQRHYIQKK